RPEARTRTTGRRARGKLAADAPRVRSRHIIEASVPWRGASFRPGGYMFLARITRRCLVLFAGCTLALLTAPGLYAQAAVVSAPISGVHYDVTADSAAVGSRRLGVAMTFDVSSTRPVVLALPAWSPGHYTLLWFSRRVSNFKAESNGVHLDWRLLDYQTWEIRPRGAGTVRVSFNYLADTVDRAVAWTSPNFAFFNGTNVFLYPVGRGF